jgi:sec-independent protein translocase protein TatB
MFDVGFSEIVVIGVVALIVIGPEKLPKVARTMGHMFGRLQRYVNEVKADINREMELDELRKLQTQMQGAARDIEQSVTSAASEVESGVRSVEAQLNEAAAGEKAGGQPAAPSVEPRPAETPSSEQKPATAATGEAPQQAALPGFERI